jgi:putative FmdB family regulatory protein
MAIYEYVCPSCKIEFERRVRMSQATTAVKCDCGREANRKLSMFAISGSESADFDFDMPMGGGCACGGGGCACSA